MTTLDLWRDERRELDALLRAGQGYADETGPLRQRLGRLFGRLTRPEQEEARAFAQSLRSQWTAAERQREFV